MGGLLLKRIAKSKQLQESGVVFPIDIEEKTIVKKGIYRGRALLRSGFIKLDAWRSFLVKEYNNYVFG